MASQPAVKASPSSTIPPNLASQLFSPKTPWRISPALFERIQKQAQDVSGNKPKLFVACDVSQSDPECAFVMKYFLDQKPKNYGVRRILCVHNPAQTQGFESALQLLEAGAKNFPPAWQDEEPKAQRANTMKRWDEQTRQFSPIEISSSKRTNQVLSCRVVPLWQGTSHAESICENGFTFFGKHHLMNSSAKAGANQSTDIGFFGSGIYCTNSANYASMYDSGTLLLTFVSMRPPFPVVSDVPIPERGRDMRMLEARGAYQNYTAHYIPVTSAYPEDPENMAYHPCYQFEQPAWDEYVVFQTAHTLVRFRVELGVDFPAAPSAPKDDHKSCEKPCAQKPSPATPPTELEFLQQRAADGNVQAQYALGLRYDKGNGVERNYLAAREWYEKAAAQGHSVAQCNIGILYYNGHGVERNYLTANGWFEKATFQGNAAAQCYLGILYHNGLGVERNYTTARSWYEKAAAQGDVDAQFNLSVLYGNGLGVEQNYTTARVWLEKAASQGDALAKMQVTSQQLPPATAPPPAKPVPEPESLVQRAAAGNVAAQYELGLRYYEGRGVERNYTTAREWYEKAAAQGHAAAQYYLGLIYFRGYGVERNLITTSGWWERAASQGDATAQYNLGMLYENGYGVFKNLSAAREWWEKAAAQGNDWAKEALAKLPTASKSHYDLKDDNKSSEILRVPKHSPEIPSPAKPSAAKPLSELESLQKSAAARDAEAQYALGLRYDKGDGVKQNYKTAREWYGKASAQGHAAAQYNLGVLYYNGHGIKKNIPIACEMWKKAAELGYAQAQYHLGVLYFYGGVGVEQSYNKARGWYARAAMQGHPDASKNLADIAWHLVIK